MVIILIGVSGAGKTTVGRVLAEDLNWPFFDGDDFHPAANVDKMTQQIPLTDNDRQPWLEVLQAFIHERLQRHEPAILACSALKEAYRQLLLQGNEGARLIFLKGDYELILNRINKRQHEYMPVELLRSQFEALEEPDDVLQIDISDEPEQLAQSIRQKLGL